MKISLDWLQDFITLIEADPQCLADRLTEGIAEVEEVETQGAMLDKCVVGNVIAVSKHPNADALSLCQVQTEAGIKRVVCGGTNLREGMRVAFAHAGATVRWHGTEMQTLQKVKIRGEESEGMICAAEELDLKSRFPESTERSIIDLGDGDEGVGTPLRSYLGLTDTVFHIDNHAITHRADLFSHIGIARELVALGLAAWKEERRIQKMPLFGKAAISFKAINEVPELIPRYCSCILSVEGLGETPAFMRRRLEATGWRSVNLPVDITNYVAMETGMPLHSFDAGDLKGDVHMRLSKRGESIMTLDGVERVLPDSAVVLSDKAGIFDLLGIMGGMRSSTKDTTRQIYLHAASVDPVSIRRAIIATGHRTDAATVYEKGIPRISVERGFFRAAELFLAHVPGARIESRMESWGDDGEPQSITLSLPRVRSVLGTEVTKDDAHRILRALEFHTESARGRRADEAIVVTPPLHRLGDIRGPHDVTEEIGRIIGYNAIPASMPAAAVTPPPRDPRMHQIRDALREEKFVEIVPLAFTNPAALARAGLDPERAVRVRNALGEELSLLQTSTVPALLEHAQRNILEAGDDLRTFHWAHVFTREGGRIQEHAELGLLFANIRGEDADLLPRDPFLQLKRSLTEALRLTGYALLISACDQVPSSAHPGRAAQLVVESVNIGTISELHPDLRAAYDLPHRAAVASIDLVKLLGIPPAETIFTPLPQFPAVAYDVTVPLDPTTVAADLLKKIRSTSPLLEEVYIADLYTGTGDRGTMTLHFTYRAADRTLTEEEAKKEHEKAVEVLTIGRG
ncbi:MAG: phenylalanyl-tRNA synthetase subunit beta [Candidatus Peregrinibacteria bacterium Greene0416_19]|nr:MAG: phenylalanyl-tRNA synthetase subunit beta [Candidatus Peregrinibacteria bacterium Greene0416_19]